MAKVALANMESERVAFEACTALEARTACRDALRTRLADIFEDGRGKRRNQVRLPFTIGSKAGRWLADVGRTFSGYGIFPDNSFGSRML